MGAVAHDGAGDPAALQDAFSWHGRDLTREETEDRGEPPPVYASRFPPGLELLARLYRRLLADGIMPPIVDAMRPSQIAAVLRLDETNEVIAGTAPVKAAPADPDQPGYVPPPDLPPVDQSVPRAQRLAAHLDLVETG